MPIVCGIRDVHAASDGDQAPAAAASSVAPLGLQAATELEANKWALLWDELAEDVQPTFDLRRAPPPQSLHPWMVKTACQSFPTDTGLSADAWKPRAVLRLSDEAIRALCHLLIAVELHGAWPDIVRTITVVLLPKADGGRRPIGLLLTTGRIWMRA